MKKQKFRICSLLLACALLLSACVPPAVAPPSSSALTSTLTSSLAYPATTPTEPTPTEPTPTEPDPAPAPTSPIVPLSSTHNYKTLQTLDGVEPFGVYWLNTSALVGKDFSNDAGLLYSLTFGDNNTFPSSDALPEGYDPQALLEWGKYPGLNVDILHKYGFTGKGATIAYVDQPIAPHEQYSGDNIHYTNNTNSSESMHGPAVLSLLAGKDIGTAPDAEIYFYGHSSWLADQRTRAECLYQIIEQNKSLPEGQKISMVGFSDNIDASEAYEAEFRAAVQACEEAGIMVFFCADYNSASFLPLSDKNNPENLTYSSWTSSRDAVCVPDSGRTTAATMQGNKYIYWSNGGLSWTMPYVLGLYAIAYEIDPTLTREDLLGLLSDTAYINTAGIKIVNPVGFIAAVLRRVSRNAEADAMLAEVAARNRYIYAIMDTASLSQEDLSAIGTYLAALTDATVLVVDASHFASAEEIYVAMQEDAAQRSGSVAGVQIFGTASMVPSFSVQYKAQMISGVYEGGTFLTDLFYGNLNNDAARISNGYNVLDHFAQNWDVDLVPQWPVARLPLSKGEFSAFFKKYQQFALDTGLENLDIVNFSNPIFNSIDHIDSMGQFITRMDEEFSLIDTAYRLYANLDGDAPVTSPVLGGFTHENLIAENSNGTIELIINSHGQWNNIDQCIFVNGKEIRISFLNTDNINTILSTNPYYLNTHTCLNGYGMDNNLTTTALNGQCVGMFSATTIISNNGINWKNSIDKLQQSNFYYFYYCYFKALHEGNSRSQSFFLAQQGYAQALLADSANGIRGDGNYQFNLHNLLAYHNFGVLEPNVAAMSLLDHKGYIAQAGQSVPKGATLTTVGTPIEKARPLRYTLDTSKMTSGTPVIHGCTIQKLDNDHIRVTLEYTAPMNMSISVFNPPKGDLFKKITNSTGTEKQSLVFDLASEDLKTISGVTVKFYASKESFYIFFNASNLR